jgi:hypothetical protein
LGQSFEVKGLSKPLWLCLSCPSAVLGVGTGVFAWLGVWHLSMILMSLPVIGSLGICTRSSVLLAPAFGLRHASQD